MRKIVFLTCLFLCSFLASGQTFVLSGNVTAKNGKMPENVTVYLLKSKDSSIVTYGSAAKSGHFSLKTNRLSEATLFRVEAERYGRFEKHLADIHENIDFGEIELQKENISDIEEVKILASPVKIKKDTIEFNASSIKVRPDSKIEELLKQIPGVEISNEGKITVNGKEVDQIMINGKPFFDKDGKIALQNIPADIIKSIQFTTTKTAQEEADGKAAKSDKATINFNIDEAKNKGFIGRLTGGYGSDDRYESNLLASYFKKDTKISLLASSNNINSQGFSNDEVFDSMGNGRNAWLMQGGSVVRSGGNTYYTMNDGGGKGIVRSSLVGMHYADKFGKEVDLRTLSGMYVNSSVRNQSKAERTTLLPENSFKTLTESAMKNDRSQFSYDQSMMIRPDSLTSIYVAPVLDYSKGVNTQNNQSATFRDGILLNESTAEVRAQTESFTFAPNIYFSRKLSKKGRRISSSVYTEMSENKENNFNISQTRFYQNSGVDDLRNQRSDTKDSNESYSFSGTYTEPVSDSSNVYVGLQYSSGNRRNFRNVHHFNGNSHSYSDFDAQLSNRMNQRIRSIAPTLGYELNKDKLNVWLDLSLKLSNMKVNSAFADENFGVEKDFVLPEVSFGVNWTMKNGGRLYMYQDMSYTLPTAQQLTPYTDTINPLFSITGNEGLKNMWKSNTSLYFNQQNIAKNLNYYLNFVFSYTDHSVADYNVYDASGKLFSTYVNVDGNKQINLGGGFTKTFKWDAHKLSVNPRFYLTYNYAKGFVDAVQYTSNVYSASPRLSLTYELKDRITVKPSYNLSYYFSNYDNYSIRKSHTAYNQLKLELTNYFMKGNVVFGNDLQYNTNSAIAPGFKRDFYFWNTSLGYSFLNKQLTAKFKIYDVLNQNQSVRRNVTASYIEDREDLILKRYFMLSLSLKLNKFSGKKNP